MTGQGPQVSIVMPAYRSERTVGETLDSISAQTWRDAEVIVVDSSPDERTADEVRRFPDVMLLRSGVQLTPHAARNRGVAASRGSLLVFTDPDILMPPDWLVRLVAAHDEAGGIIVGAIACHGRRYLDNAIHICKFSRFLSGGRPRPIDVGPTGNLLVPRAVFDAVGPFPDGWIGDVAFSRAARSAGVELRFEPAATVAHHHVHTLGSFLRERFERGALFGAMRVGWLGHSRAKVLGFLAASVLPLRLARILAMTAGHCVRAGCFRWYLPSLPVVTLGHAASLAGESRAYVRAILYRSRADVSQSVAAGPVHP